MVRQLPSAHSSRNSAHPVTSYCGCSWAVPGRTVFEARRLVARVLPCVGPERRTVIIETPEPRAAR